jgi:hypothetical protein
MNTDDFSHESFVRELRTLDRQIKVLNGQKSQLLKKARAFGLSTEAIKRDAYHLGDQV